MLRRLALLRCSAAAAQTLTAWLARLAEQAEALPALPSPATTVTAATADGATASPASSSTHSSGTSTAAAQLLRDIEDAATHANALRETDTLFTVLHCVLKKRHFPADAEVWGRLAEQLLPFGGIEATTVLHYPGQPSAVVRREGYGGGVAASDARSGWSGTVSSSYSASGAAPETPFRFPITRETLLLTGGVVPLSARVPCGDGRMVALFLDDFVQYVRACREKSVVEMDSSENVNERGGSGSGGSSAAGASLSEFCAPSSADLLKAVRSVSKATLRTLKANASTLQWELLLPSLLEYLRVLHELDLDSAASVLRDPNTLQADVEGEREAEQDGAAPPEDDAEGAESDTAKPTEHTRLLQRMLDGLAYYALADGAHGARVALHYLNDFFSSVVEAYASTQSTARLSEERAQQLYWRQQRYWIALTRRCMRAIYLYYVPSTFVSSTRVSGMASTCLPCPVDLVLTAPMNDKIESLYDQIDVVFQENTNAGNPLRVDDTVISQLRDIHTLALLRALRIEEEAPDAYLRRALEVVDRVPASMAIEGELIAGKVRLLDLDSDIVDKDGRTAVYKDLLTSLRNLVEMRPRFARKDGAQDEGNADGSGELSNNDINSSGGGGGGSDAWEEGGGDGEEDTSVRLDAVTQGILQRAHADVITAFCAAHTDEWLNEAYNIIVTHKYHGVKITKELILPLLEVFSRRGDCRAFNVVDLCVLYSNETVDMQTIALLFRTCAAAGDHYRARTFLQLLNEIIPGFLVKCPQSVRESLQELKLLNPPPRHLFVSAEDDLVQSALGEETRTVRRLPDAA